MMTPSDFREGIERRQRRAATTELPDHVLTASQCMLALYGLGVSGEAGEVSDEIKKVLFHDKPLDARKILVEVGDVLWYCDRICKAIGHTVEEAMQANAAKLDLRYPAGFDAAPKKFDHQDGG